MTTVNKCGINMAYIPEGTFTMSSGKDAKKIYLSAYCIDKYEFTNADATRSSDKLAKRFAAYATDCKSGERSIVAVGNDPKKLLEKFKGKIDHTICKLDIEAADKFKLSLGSKEHTEPNQPLISISWETANKFCKEQGKRLPTRAEWEKAAKGPQGSLYATQSGQLTKDEARYDSDNPTNVGSYPPNGYGVYDMTGNALEWVSDWFNKEYMKKNMESNNPKGPSTGFEKIISGGAYYTRKPEHLTTDYVNSLDPKETGYSGVGFRCVTTPKS